MQQLDPGSRRSGAHAVPVAAVITTGNPVPGGGASQAENVTLGEILRPETALGRLGAVRRDLPFGWVSNLDVAPGRVTAGWSDPITGEAPPVQEFNLGTSRAKPRELVVEVEASRRMLRWVPQAEQLLLDALGEAAESETERVALVGTGKDGQPLGLLQLQGAAPVQAQAVAGAVPTYSELTTGLQLALDAGARLRRCGFLLSLADHDALVQLERPGGHPALVEGPEGWTLAGRPVEFSAWVPSGQAVCGEFAQVGIFYQGLPQILVNPYTKSHQGATRVSMFDLIDVSVSRPQLLTLIGA